MRISILSLCVLAWSQIGCNEASPSKTIRVDIKDCLEAAIGAPSLYNQCAQAHNAPFLETLRGCFVWRSHRSSGSSTLHFRDGWVPDPDQSGTNQIEQERITEAAFFVIKPTLSCNSLLPSTVCRALPDCLVKLSQGRQVDDGEPFVTFRSEAEVCAVDNLLPSDFQQCVERTTPDQRLHHLDGGAPTLDGTITRPDETDSTIAGPTCSDGIQNGNETDVDCGGEGASTLDVTTTPCEPCDLDARCRNESDCTSRSCIDSVCAAADCNDDLQNGDETDIDCGGVCGACSDNSRCNEPTDCASSVCNGRVCQPPQCDDGVKNGDEAGTDCGGECSNCNACAQSTDCNDDFVCINNLCSPRLANGQTCETRSHCQSGHCRNRVCCDAGTCCNSVSDCPGSFSSPSRCDNSLTCQGTRVDAICRSFQCDSEATGDDSGCNGQIANTCGPYPSIACNSQRNQSAPQCAMSCLNNSGCDTGLNCINGNCTLGAENGRSCTLDAQCASAHCQNGYCCNSGDCCMTTTDCLSDYASPSSCNDPSSCQGTRTDAVCESNRCASVSAADDSGCNGLVADNCGPYPSATCTNQRTQSAPQCNTSCSSDNQCDLNQICYITNDPTIVDGTCQPPGANGTPCTSDNQCVSGHCQNGFCCLGGDCCQAASDCDDDYRQPPVCTEPESCQGQRGDPSCSSSRCQLTIVDDDSACTAMSFTENCLTYLNVSCSGDIEQTSPRCATSCTNDAQCKTHLECLNGICTIDIGNL